MAQKTVVRLVDDLDDTEIKDGEGQTVRFGLDGTSYEIDLTNENAEQLRQALTRYVESARKAGGKPTRPSAAKTAAKAPAKTDVSPQAVREWAKSNGVELSARGRIPRSVIDQFQAAGN